MTRVDALTKRFLKNGKRVDRFNPLWYNKENEREVQKMEKRYWELREDCRRTFNRWMANQSESNLQAYKEALSTYQDFCMDVLERLMDENADVLKNLKDWG